MDLFISDANIADLAKRSLDENIQFYS